jgi:hypothetical protein
MPNQHIGLVDARLHLLALLEGMVRAGTLHYCITVCVVCCIGTHFLYSVGMTSHRASIVPLRCACSLIHSRPDHSSAVAL